MRLQCSLSSKTLQLEWFTSRLQEIRKKAWKIKYIPSSFRIWTSNYCKYYSSCTLTNHKLVFPHELLSYIFSSGGSSTQQVSTNAWRQRGGHFLRARGKISSQTINSELCVKEGQWTHLTLLLRINPLQSPWSQSRSRSLHYGNLRGVRRSPEFRKR